MQPHQELHSILFDIGNVLIDWDPRHLYRKIFVTEDGQPDDTKITWFLDTICTMAWNVAQDRGRSIADANQELITKWPDYSAEITAYYERFQEMITGPIAASQVAFDHFRSCGFKIYGLTNFSRETFPPTRERFAILQQFDDVLVSGEEGLIKPDPAIFNLAIDRFGLIPATTLFIDDSAANIATAMQLGFQTHHFTTGSQRLIDGQGIGGAISNLARA